MTMNETYIFPRRNLQNCSWRVVIVYNKFAMKTKMLKFMFMLSTFMLVISASEYCFCFFHQPKVPANLNRFSKIK